MSMNRRANWLGWLCVCGWCGCRRRRRRRSSVFRDSDDDIDRDVDIEYGMCDVVDDLIFIDCDGEMDGLDTNSSLSLYLVDLN